VPPTRSIAPASSPLRAALDLVGERRADDADAGIVRAWSAVARVHYQSQTLTALEFLPVEEQPGYSLWDFDLTYSTAAEPLLRGRLRQQCLQQDGLELLVRHTVQRVMTGTLQAPRVFGIRTGVHF